MTHSIVKFKHVDYRLPAWLDEDSAKAVAHILYIDSALIGIVEGLLRIICSKCKAGQEWKANFTNDAKRKFRLLNISYNKELIDLIVKCFESCQDIKDSERMKGLIPEKYVEYVYEKRYEGQMDFLLEFGCNVIINGSTVKLLNEELEATSKGSGRRESMDVAAWNGMFGDFIEVKFQPEAFAAKEVLFMKEIANEMEKNELKHFERFYTWSDRELALLNLEKLECWDENRIAILVCGEITKINTVSQYNLNALAS